MFKNLCFTVLFLLWMQNIATAQPGKLDSMLRLLETTAADTNKVNLYWKIVAASTCFNLI